MPLRYKNLGYILKTLTYTWNGHEFGSAGLPPTILLSSNVGIVSLGPMPQTKPIGGLIVVTLAGFIVTSVTGLGVLVVPHVTGLLSVDVGQQYPIV